MARRGYGQSPFSNYDSWKTTDPRDGADGEYDRVPCSFRKDDTYIDRWGRKHTESHYCNVPYEDHNDEELGHEFVQPEIGSRE